MDTADKLLAMGGYFDEAVLSQLSLKEVADEIQSLRQQIAELEADAKRYRWLKDNVTEVYARKQTSHTYFNDLNMQWQIRAYLVSNTCINSHVPFDESIDLAMEKQNDN